MTFDNIFYNIFLFYYLEKVYLGICVNYDTEPESWNTLHH